MDQEVFGTIFQEDIFQIKPKPIVVINEEWGKLGDKERELLSKIIAALKISLDGIIVLSRPQLDIPAYVGQTNQLIYFGELPAGVSQYEVLQSGDLSFICSASLSQLLDNEPARKQLWQGLRKLFAV